MPASSLKMAVYSSSPLDEAEVGNEKEGTIEVEVLVYFGGRQEAAEVSDVGGRGDEVEGPVVVSTEGHDLLKGYRQALGALALANPLPQSKRSVLILGDTHVTKKAERTGHGTSTGVTSSVPFFSF